MDKLTPHKSNTFHSSTDSGRIPRIPAGICRNPTGIYRKSRYLGYMLLPNRVITLNLVLIYIYQDLLTYLSYVVSQPLNLFQANDLIRLISCDTKLEHSKLNCIY